MIGRVGFHGKAGYRWLTSTENGWMCIQFSLQARGLWFLSKLSFYVYMCNSMLRCEILCKDVIFYAKLWYWDVKFYVKMWYSMSRCEILCQDVKFYVKMWNSMSRCDILCQDVKFYVKMWNSLSRCEFLCRDVIFYVKMWKYKNLK